MATTISDLRARARTPGGQRAIKYTLVSVISVVVSQVALLILFGVFHFGAKPSNITAVIIGGIPSYTLNRRWAWGKTGKSHLWREVVPFWVLAFLGLVLSTWAVDFAESFGNTHFANHLYRTLGVNFANIAAFGVLWIGKFVIFNKLMFVDHHKPAGD